MSSLSSSPSYRLFKVLYSFDAEGAEEMSVGKDDLVFGLYEEFNSVDDWALVSIKRGGTIEKGFVPKEYLKEVESVSSSDTDGDADADADADVDDKKRGYFASSRVSRIGELDDDVAGLDRGRGSREKYGEDDGNEGDVGAFRYAGNDISINKYNNNGTNNSNNDNNNNFYNNGASSSNYNRNIRGLDTVIVDDFSAGLVGSDYSNRFDEFNRPSSSGRLGALLIDDNDRSASSTSASEDSDDDSASRGDEEEEEEEVEVKIKERTRNVMSLESLNRSIADNRLRPADFQYHDSPRDQRQDGRYAREERDSRKDSPRVKFSDSDRDSNRGGDAPDNDRVRNGYNPPQGSILRNSPPHSSSSFSYISSSSMDYQNSFQNNQMNQTPTQGIMGRLSAERNNNNSDNNDNVPIDMPASGSSQNGRFSVRQSAYGSRNSGLDFYSSTPQSSSSSSSTSKNSNNMSNLNNYDYTTRALSSSGSGSIQGKGGRGGFGGEPAMNWASSPNISRSASRDALLPGSSSKRSIFSGPSSSSKQTLGGSSSSSTSSGSGYGSSNYSNSSNGNNGSRDSALDFDMGVNLDRILASSMESGNFDDLIRKNEEFFSKILSSQLDTFQSVTEISGNLSTKLSDTSKECQELVDDLTKLDEYIDDERRRLKQYNEYEKSADIIARARDIAKFT